MAITCIMRAAVVAMIGTWQGPMDKTGRGQQWREGLEWLRGDPMNPAGYSDAEDACTAVLTGRITEALREMGNNYGTQG